MALRMTEEEYSDFLKRRGGTERQSVPLIARKKKKKSKYGNERIEVDGKRFDSKHEAEVYRQLCFLRAAGEVKVIMRQVPFDLPGGVIYKADFCTVDKNGVFQVIDAKSEATSKDKVYRIKKKQMFDIWGLEILEI